MLRTDRAFIGKKMATGALTLLLIQDSERSGLAYLVPIKRQLKQTPLTCTKKLDINSLRWCSSLTHLCSYISFCCFCFYFSDSDFRMKKKLDNCLM